MRLESGRTAKVDKHALLPALGAPNDPPALRGAIIGECIAGIAVGWASRQVAVVVALRKGETGWELSSSASVGLEEVGGVLERVCGGPRLVAAVAYPEVEAKTQACDLIANRVVEEIGPLSPRPLRLPRDFPQSGPWLRSLRGRILESGAFARSKGEALEVNLTSPLLNAHQLMEGSDLDRTRLAYDPEHPAFDENHWQAVAQRAAMRLEEWPIASVGLLCRSASHNRSPQRQMTLTVDAALALRVAMEFRAKGESAVSAVGDSGASMLVMKNGGRIEGRASALWAQECFS